MSMTSDREWTGSVSNLPESMRQLAIEMANLSAGARDEFLSEERSNVTGELRKLAAFLQDHAYTLGEWADAVEQLYAPIAAPAGDTNGDVPTNAQGIALARFLRPAFRDSVHPGDRSAHVSRGGLGLGDDYLLVRLADGYTGGIDRDGRTST